MTVSIPITQFTQIGALALSTLNETINRLTVASLLVLAVLLRKPFQPALKAMLPKFLKPRVSEVCFWPEFQIIIIKPLDIGGLELDCNSSNSFSLVPICHVIPVSPAVTGETHTQKQAHQLRSKLSQGNKSFWFEIPLCKVATAGLSKTLYSLPEVTVTYQPVRSKKQGSKMMENLDFRCQKAINLPWIIDKKLAFLMEFYRFQNTL